jgi:hypothetical protein
MSYEENLEEARMKRVYKIVGGVTVTIALLIGGLLWATSNGDAENNEIQGNVELTSQEKLSAVETSKDFINTVGNFGVITEQLTGDNIQNVGYLIGTEDPGAKDYVIPRSESYSLAQSKFIYPDSSLDYDTRAVSQWSNGLESEKLMTFEITDLSAAPADSGQYVKINNENVKAIQVEVVFTSKEIIRDVTANDTTWDGSYSVLEKSFGNNTADLLLVENESEWKVYSLNNLENQFLLSTWENPSSEEFSFIQTDFVPVDTLNRTEPYKEPKS